MLNERHRKTWACLSVSLVVVGLSFSAWAPAQTSLPAQAQIGPGSTGSINHGIGAAPAGKPHKILAGALTPATRQTLQEAMDSPNATTPAK